MDTKAETAPTLLDTAKLAVAALVLLGGLAGYYYFADSSMLWRVLGLVAGLVLGVVIAFQSMQGRQVWQFMQGSQVEIRKVVWPTQQETMQATLMVIVFTVVLSVFFFLLDLLLLNVTQFLTGQGS